MSRENKNEAIARLHRQRIIQAAGELFAAKGFEKTTIDDISDRSGYSRRTLYAYFGGKEDMLCHIAGDELERLYDELGAAVTARAGFNSRCMEVCRAMRRYRERCPEAARLSEPKPELSPARERTAELGEKINSLLAGFIGEGLRSGAVRRTGVPELSVHILLAGVNSVSELYAERGEFICEQLGITKEKFFDYGFRQQLNSILTEWM